MSDERAANHIDQHIGARVRLRRIMLGVSQERLAEMLGITFQQVQKYEKGVNRIAASRLWEIAASLDASVSYFFEGISGSSAKGFAEDGAEPMVFDLIASPDGAQLAAAYSNISSPKVRRLLIDLMRAMSDDPIPTGKK